MTVIETICFRCKKETVVLYFVQLPKEIMCDDCGYRDKPLNLISKGYLTIRKIDDENRKI